MPAPEFILGATISGKVISGVARGVLWFRSERGTMPDASPALPQKRTPLRARHVFYLILGLAGFALITAPEWFTPWLYFLGGSFHATPWWSGAGSFAAPDGTYQLYLYLSPLDSGSHPTLRTDLAGDGHLCTPSGERLIIHVEADMDKHLPWNTLGKSIEISSFTPSRFGIGGMKALGSPYVRLTGVWGPGKIDAKGTLEHELPAPGHPAPPKPAPISVTLQQSGEWWPPSCRAH